MNRWHLTDEIEYKKGFEKCKEIDDGIIDYLVNEKHILLGYKNEMVD